MPLLCKGCPAKGYQVLARSRKRSQPEILYIGNVTMLDTSRPHGYNIFTCEKSIHFNPSKVVQGDLRRSHLCQAFLSSSAKVATVLHLCKETKCQVIFFCAIVGHSHVSPFRSAPRHRPHFVFQLIGGSPSRPKIQKRRSLSGKVDDPKRTSFFQLTGKVIHQRLHQRLLSLVATSTSFEDFHCKSFM